MVEIQGVNFTFIMMYILNRIAEGVTYPWSDEFCRDQNKKAMREAYDMIKVIDFHKLTTEEAISIGFIPRQERNPDLMMVPMWLYAIIPEGESVEFLLGIKAVKGVDFIDDDNRAGFTKYSIVINQDKKQPPAEPSYFDDTIRIDEMDSV